jgi:hypothetical protein
VIEEHGSRRRARHGEQRARRLGLIVEPLRASRHLAADACLSVTSFGS